MSALHAGVAPVAPAAAVPGAADREVAIELVQLIRLQPHGLAHKVVVPR